MKSELGAEDGQSKDGVATMPADVDGMEKVRALA